MHEVVLDRDRHAGERARVLAPRDRGVDRVGGRERLVGQHEVERVDLGLPRVDRGEVLLDAPSRAERCAGADVARRSRVRRRHGASPRMRGTRNRPSSAAARPRALRRGRGVGRTSSARNTFTSGSGWAVGGTSSSVERLDVGGVSEDRAELGGQVLDLVVGERETRELRDVLDVGTCDAFGHDGRV